MSQSYYYSANPSPTPIIPAIVEDDVPRTPIPTTVENGEPPTERSAMNAMVPGYFYSPAPTYQVKPRSRGKGMPHRTGDQTTPLATPGAVSVGGKNQTVHESALDNLGTSSVASAGIHDSFVAYPPPQVVAQLAPDDDEDIEARIAERVRRQMEGHIIVAAEVNQSSICGLKKRTICILPMLALLLVIGAVVGGVLYSMNMGGNDDTTSPNSAPNVDPTPITTSAPTSSSSVSATETDWPTASSSTSGSSSLPPIATDWPTFSPTAPPTDGSFTPLVVDFRTDSWPEEITIELDYANGDIHVYRDFNANSSYFFSENIPDDGCTLLNVTDSGGDGLLDDGFVKVTYGSSVLYEGGDFGFGFDILFGSGCS